MNRALIYAHYNKHGGLSSYVVYTLEQLKPLFNKIVFVSNSPLSKPIQKSLRLLCSRIKVRENKGYDFGAWRNVIDDAGWEELSKFDSLTFMNDTCFGPLYDVTPIYQKMEEQNIDYWGLTNNIKLCHGISKTRGYLLDYIQSYFMVFDKQIIVSEVFQRFWRTIRDDDDKKLVEQSIESRLTLVLRDAGFIIKSFIDTYADIDDKSVVINSPLMLLEHDLPFFKVKNFLSFPYPGYLKKVIHDNYKDYPIKLIDEHFTENYNPNISINISKKNIIFQNNSYEYRNSDLKIALHLHAYYLDIFEKYIKIIRSRNINVDLYITTDTNEKKQQIKKILDNLKTPLNIISIKVYNNRGRDILPWINLSDILNTYDIVGHFHTKKSEHRSSWFGMHWQDTIFNSLLIPAHEVFNLFQKDAKLGIVIPDIPFYFRHLHTVNTFDGQSGVNRENCKTLWNKMSLLKKIDFSKLDTPIMAYGNMFWYRPEALSPLFKLGLKEKNFPKEPIKGDETIAHAIERLPVYIAWSVGYDFKVAQCRQEITTGFEYKIYQAKVEKEIKANKIRKSILCKDIFKNVVKNMGRLFSIVKL